MAKLYEIVAEYRDAADRLNDMDLPPEVVADTLESLAGDLEAKAENIAFIIRDLQADAEKIRVDAVRQAVRAKSLTNRAEWLQKWLLDTLVCAEVTKIKGIHFDLSIRDNPPAVVIDDEEKIPYSFYIYPDVPPRYLDKKLLAVELKLGNTEIGAHLERGKRLEIK